MTEHTYAGIKKNEYGVWVDSCSCGLTFISMWGFKCHLAKVKKTPPKPELHPDLNGKVWMYEVLELIEWYELQLKEKSK